MKNIMWFALFFIFSCEKHEIKFVKNSYSNGNIEKIGTLINGIEQGVTRTYYLDGKINQISEVENGIANGKNITFYRNGSIEGVNNYVNGRVNGQTIRYDSLGTKIFEYTMIMDSLNGDYKEYDSLGRIKEITHFENNKVNGKRYLFHENGTIKALILSKNGRSRTYIYFRKNGEIERSMNSNGLLSKEDSLLIPKKVK